MNLCLELYVNPFRFTTPLMQTTNGVRVIMTLDLIGSAGLEPIIPLTAL
jgi:hypothetical protein